MTHGSAAHSVRRNEDDDVLGGLRAPRKHLPNRLLYEGQGAELFERVTTSDAYYPARTELALLRQHAATLAHHIGPEARIVEAGGTDSIRTRLVLSALERPSSYVAIDLAHDQLQRSTALLRTAFPTLEVQPVTADYLRGLDLPVPQHEWRRTLLMVPGSRLGNLEPSEACAFLKLLADAAGPDRLLLFGADSTREPRLLHRAYDDEYGVAGEFNKHVLAHLNATRGATFALDGFEHRTLWNDAASRIELHLASVRRQVVQIDDTSISFNDGESIVTEHSYKHTPVAMHAILASAGWRPRHVFTATQVPYRLWLCEPLTWSR